MRIAKWGNSLAVRIPSEVAKALGLKEGEEVEGRIVDGGFTVLRDRSRQRAIKRIRELARPLPPGWKFDRDEANAR